MNFKKYRKHLLIFFTFITLVHTATQASDAKWNQNICKHKCNRLTCKIPSRFNDCAENCQTVTQQDLIQNCLKKNIGDCSNVASRNQKIIMDFLETEHSKMEQNLREFTEALEKADKETISDGVFYKKVGFHNGIKETKEKLVDINLQIQACNETFQKASETKN